MKKRGKRFVIVNQNGNLIVEQRFKDSSDAHHQLYQLELDDFAYDRQRKYGNEELETFEILEIDLGE